MTLRLWLTILAGTLLYGQTFPREPRAFPPDIGPPKITVTGIDGKSTDLTMAELGKLPQHIVKAAEHGVPVQFEGVLLTDILAQVARPTGDQFHGTAAGYYVLIEAADGYKAVFAWAEQDPGFMEKPVYLVTHRDGKPLAAKEGPFELVAPGEKRNGRWVRQVTAISIRQAG